MTLILQHDATEITILVLLRFFPNSIIFLLISENSRDSLLDSHCFGMVSGEEILLD